MDIFSLSYYIVVSKALFYILPDRPHKNSCFHDILHYGDETLKIVEAIAEHDFCILRLIVMFSAKE